MIRSCGFCGKFMGYQCDKCKSTHVIWRHRWFSGMLLTCVTCNHTLKLGVGIQEVNGICEECRVHAEQHIKREYLKPIAGHNITLNYPNDFSIFATKTERFGREAIYYDIYNSTGAVVMSRRVTE